MNKDKAARLIGYLKENFKCSACRTNFDSSVFKVVGEGEHSLVTSYICPGCGRDYSGVINEYDLASSHVESLPLSAAEMMVAFPTDAEASDALRFAEAEAISADDVLDVRDFAKHYIPSKHIL
jgi:DNA-directed RNA polymerase subunit RPC12/RpoP